MSDIIKEAREVLEGVTPGPWVAYGEPEVGLPSSLFAGEIGDLGFGPIEPLQGADLHFCAWAREGVPALIARAEAAEAALAHAWEMGRDAVKDKLDNFALRRQLYPKHPSDIVRGRFEGEQAACGFISMEARNLTPPADLAKRLGVSHEPT